MKNTTKKIFSMLLAVIMLLSVMPVAFATENSVKDDFIEEFTKHTAYVYNLYDPNMSVVSPLFLTDTFQELLRTNNEEEMLLFTENMREKNTTIKEKIASREFTVVIDTYEFFKVYIELHAIISDPLKMEDFMEIKTRNIELFSEVDTDAERLYDFFENRAGSQADFDAIVEKTLYASELTVKHLNGEHDFVEYISNNDSSEESNGTKTSTCEFCGATDTIAEGSKLADESTTFIERIFGFFKKIFERIIAFFQNLFEGVVDFFRNLF